ncbi:hypothetical protein SBA3_1060016 [Candidatus Sulfopaludibacter sp. SbA3]|nr:hypothetical protein SBA3_1060016 [Candidatus Sulfopaludibacter sp. SbA3]
MAAKNSTREASILLRGPNKGCMGEMVANRMAAVSNRGPGSGVWPNAAIAIRKAPVDAVGRTDILKN